MARYAQATAYASLDKQVGNALVHALLTGVVVGCALPRLASCAGATRRRRPCPFVRLGRADAGGPALAGDLAPHERARRSSGSLLDGCPPSRVNGSAGTMKPRSPHGRAGSRLPGGWEMPGTVRPSSSTPAEALPKPRARTRPRSGASCARSPPMAHLLRGRRLDQPRLEGVFVVPGRLGTMPGASA